MSVWTKTASIIIDNKNTIDYFRRNGWRETEKLPINKKFSEEMEDEMMNTTAADSEVIN